MANNVKKTECPVSREQFTAKATALKVMINDQSRTAEVKEFSSGSFGWYLGDRITVMIDGKPVKCMVGLNITVIGSKDQE